MCLRGTRGNSGFKGLGFRAQDLRVYGFRALRVIVDSRVPSSSPTEQILKFILVLSKNERCSKKHPCLGLLMIRSRFEG